MKDIRFEDKDIRFEDKDLRLEDKDLRLEDKDLRLEDKEFPRGQQHWVTVKNDLLTDIRISVRNI